MKPEDKKPEDMKPEEKKAEREARQARQKVEGVAAMKEYRAQFDRTVANTAKLREARLARDADEIAAPAAKSVSKPAPKAAPKKAPAPKPKPAPAKKKPATRGRK